MQCSVKGSIEKACERIQRLNKEGLARGGDSRSSLQIGNSKATERLTIKSSIWVEKFIQL